MMMFNVAAISWMMSDSRNFRSRVNKGLEILCTIQYNTIQ